MNSATRSFKEWKLTNGGKTTAHDGAKLTFQINNRMAIVLAIYKVPTSGVQHLLYVIPDGTLDVYDIDSGYKLLKTIALSQLLDGVREQLLARLTTPSTFRTVGTAARMALVPS